ncbi:RimK family alpha-L-glutamate ligase [Thermodesulfobacteriota bacterium]
MILSFHPCFEGDHNIICAGRSPGDDDLLAIKAADAVILPQGCYRSLYEMARDNCPHIFPNYDVRFRYPGKIGQIKLFRKTNVSHPKTTIYETVNTLFNANELQIKNMDFDFPFVFKFDWGGEGDTVFLIKTRADFKRILQKAAIYERTGQKGFLIQEYIPSRNRSLRVVVVGQTMMSYWRIQKNPQDFLTNLAKGAVIDRDSEQQLQKAAVLKVKDFCRTTKINLAGFDILFSAAPEKAGPFFLEINHFFGRGGFSSSDHFYALLGTETRQWLKSVGLSLSST